MPGHDARPTDEPAIRSRVSIGEELRAMASGLMIIAVGAMMGLGAAYAFHII